jgi:hypothetical protein
MVIEDNNQYWDFKAIHMPSLKVWAITKVIHNLEHVVQ